MKTITNDEAFEQVEGETSQQIVAGGYDFQFTRNWFRYRNQRTWSTFLPKRFPFYLPVRMIQIGVFEGMDLVWCLQNILNHPDSSVVAIDPWAVTTKLDQDYMTGVEQRARHNLGFYKNKVEIRKGFSQDILPELIQEGCEGTFDLIVIDGDHTAKAVVIDALMSFDLAKPGAWLVFDDVRNRVFKTDHVLDGIELFLESHESKVKLEWQHRYCDCYSKVG